MKIATAAQAKMTNGNILWFWAFLHLECRMLTPKPPF